MRALFLITIFINLLFAHKVNLFITNEGNKVNVYSYFANGKPCIECRLMVKNSSQIILNDTLNNEGKYSFLAKNKSLELIIDAGSGHIAKKEFQLKDINNINLKEQIEEEKSGEFLKIIFSLVLIFLIFFILKRFKKR